MGYRFEGTERLLAFGKYPDVSLTDARKARTVARDKINAGIDPSQAKRITELAVEVINSIEQNKHLARLIRQ